jgi:MFS family permease
MSSKRQAWIVMLATFFAGIAVALNQFKVPPVMQVLIEQLKIDTVTGGWLMSSSAVAGVILGIPAAVILVRLGPKTSGLAALGCTVVGSGLGALATVPSMLLLGRVIEGIGLGLITVVAPAVVSMWFQPAERGMPMGIWASWVPLGSFVMFNLAGPLEARLGWQGVWWFGALFALIAFAVYAAVVVAPTRQGPLSGTSSVAGDAGIGKALANPASWILAFVFGTFNFGIISLSTWAPTYFNQGLGIDPAGASFDASLVSLAIIPSTLVAGWLLDRTTNRRNVLSAALLVCAVLLIWSFQLSGPGIVVPYALTLGFVAGFIPAATFTLAPETAGTPQGAGMALGIVSVGQNVGMFVGPPIVGALVGGGNWAAAVMPVAGALAIGFAASFALKTTARQSRQAGGTESI